MYYLERFLALIILSIFLTLLGSTVYLVFPEGTFIPFGLYAFAFLITLTFSFLNTLTMRLIRRIIARDYYQRNRKLRQIISDLPSIKTYRDMTKTFMDALPDIFKAEIIALLVKHKDNFLIQDAVAPYPMVLPGLAISKNHTLIDECRESKDTIFPIKYSISDLTGGKDGKQLDYHSFKVFNWAIPLKINGRVTALIILNQIPVNIRERRRDTLLKETLNQVSVLIDNRKLFDRIKRESSKQSAISNVTEVMSKTASISTIFNTILDQISTVLPIDASGVFLTSTDDSSIDKFLQRGYDRRRLNPLKLKIGRGIVGKCISENKSFLVRDIGKYAGYIKGRSATRSELCVPIKIGNNVFGAINIETNLVAAYNEDDQEFLETMGIQAGSVLEKFKVEQNEIVNTGLQKDMEKAQEVQRSLLPTEVPTHDNVAFDLKYIPNKQISGDFYDLQACGDDRFTLTIGDAVGKGISGALIMSNFYSAYKQIMKQAIPLNEKISNLNGIFNYDTDDERKITVFISELDVKKNELLYVNAGHPSPLIFHQNGQITRLEEGGPILGFSQHSEYSISRVTFCKDDLLVLYTDGLLEAVDQSGQLFDESGIIESAKGFLKLPVEEVSNALLEKLRRFTRKENFDDDLTLMMAKFSGKPFLEQSE